MNMNKAIKKYPELKEALGYQVHGQYEEAVSIYTEVLENIDQETAEYAYILLEYALCLLEVAISHFESNYKKILLLDPKNDINEGDEDLETCWECLETCRTAFDALNDHGSLARVYKGLGDIKYLNNDFEGAIDEYDVAMDHLDDDGKKIELLECISDCHRGNKEYKKAIECLEKIIKTVEQPERAKCKPSTKEYKDLIKILEFEAKNGGDGGNKTKADTDEVRDVNHLKKNKIE